MSKQHSIGPVRPSTAVRPRWLRDYAAAGTCISPRYASRISGLARNSAAVPASTEDRGCSTQHNDTSASQRTSVPANVARDIPIDMRGTTGRVVLLDRGTKLVGQIQGGLMQGQDRLFVNWVRAETPNPNHVIITLNSPGADVIGEPGLDGDIDTHFWKRSGGVINFCLQVARGAYAEQIVTSGTHYPWPGLRRRPWLEQPCSLGTSPDVRHPLVRGVLRFRFFCLHRRGPAGWRRSPPGSGANREHGHARP
jgi:hypothetical protein